MEMAELAAKARGAAGPGRLGLQRDVRSDLAMWMGCWIEIYPRR